jgi:hypothetical protein
MSNGNFTSAEKPIRVNINFYWADERFEWDLDWPLPMLPRKGDFFNLNDFIDNGYIKDWEDVEFKGNGIYTGVTTSLAGLLSDDFKVYVKEVVWNADFVWITLETTLFGEHETASNQFVMSNPY